MAAIVSNSGSLLSPGDVLYMQCASVPTDEPHYLVFLGHDAVESVYWCGVVTSSRADQEAFNRSVGEHGNVLADVPKLSFKGLKHDSVVNAAAPVRVRDDEVLAALKTGAACRRTHISPALLRGIRVCAGNSQKLLSAKRKQVIGAIVPTSASIKPFVLSPTVKPFNISVK